ncbi:MAG: RsmE family RNA methyltransferase, partial [Candidatus Acidiferrales bacterium]
MRRRFFVDQFDGDRAFVRGETAEHLGRVLRAEPGQLYELSDGQAIWLGRVEEVHRDAIRFALVEAIAAPQRALQIRLLLSIIKFDHFEWCLEKATELGVSEIVPLAAARSEKALIAASEKRSQRWKKILIESAQQSRRLCPPVLAAVERPVTALIGTLSPSIRIFLSESPVAPSIRSRLSALIPLQNPVALAIGPEGGW